MGVVSILKKKHTPYYSTLQESILFAIRHGLMLRGWTMLGKSSGVRVGTLFVKTLDLSQAKNSVDAFKVHAKQSGNLHAAFA